MRQNDRTWRPELPKAPIPGWAWGLALILVLGGVGGHVLSVLLSR